LQSVEGGMALLTHASVLAMGYSRLLFLCSFVRLLSGRSE
jgi:hypothetical protein